MDRGVSMSETIEKASQIAAQWWADVIRDPKFDNGDRSPSSMTLFSMAKACVQDLTEDQRKSFLSVLTFVVSEKLRMGGPVSLDVDYQPTGLLSKVAEETEIPETNFPIKTRMEIEDGFVSVKYGFGAKSEVLYVTTEYWNNKIKESELTIERCKEKLSKPYDGDQPWIKDLIEIHERRVKECKIELEKEIKSSDSKNK